MTTALTRSNCPKQGEDRDQRKHDDPLDAVVADPSDLAPLCDEPEFAAILEEMVADEAPRLFAVVQEYGERADGRIAAWGMAFADHVEVISVTRGLRMSLQAPENVLRMFRFDSDVRARLVWFNPDAATPAEDDEAA
jgi:hypothetical protein